MPVPPSVFEEIYRHHGHRCPMSTIGGRLGYAARRYFAGRKPEGLRGIYHARTCAVDGIEQTTGCTLTQGNLLVKDAGRHLLTLFCRESGEGVEVELRASALDLAGSYRQIGLELERSRPRMNAAEIRMREEERERSLDVLLHKLRTSPDEELLTLKPLSPGEGELDCLIRS